MPISRMFVLAASVLGLLSLTLEGCGLFGTGSRPPLPVTDLADASPEVRARLETIHNQVLARSADLQRRFAQREEELLTEHNRRQADQFAAIEQNGGVRATVEKQIESIQAEIGRASPEQRALLEKGLASLQRLIQNFAFCSTPLIFYVSGASPFSTFETADFVVRPRWDITISGCHLGDRASGRPQVRLVLSGPGGQEVTLDVRNWTDDGIEAVMPALSGVLDQPAKLFVTTASGGEAAPVDVSFIAAREWTFVDPVMHPGTLFVDCGHNTTTDSCSAYAFATTPRTLYLAGVGSHFTFCCSSVSGTDRWILSLKNGWILQILYPAVDSSPSAPGTPDLLGFWADGYTTCTFFNKEGSVTDYRQIDSTDPRVQGGEIDISWWVDHSCSGIEYGANFPIIGPAGVPYW